METLFMARSQIIELDFGPSASVTNHSSRLFKKCWLKVQKPQLQEIYF